MATYPLITFHIYYIFSEFENKFLGKLNNHQHGISGDIYKLDDRRILVENFKYDGQGPDAFFWVGTEGKSPSEQGILLAHPFR